MKKFSILLLFLLFATSLLMAQTPNVTIGGKLKITDVGGDNSADSVLVRQANGTIAQQPIPSLNDRDAVGCSLGYHVIPEDFDFQNIPTSHASSIWEIRYCHDLQNNTVTLPANVILSFKGGKLTNFQNLVGDKTGIQAYSAQIFDGNTMSGSWLLEYVNVCWFGATPNPAIDSSPFFDKATNFMTNQEVRRLLIPSGSYHLEEVWRISTTISGSWKPVQVDGYGAILDNTVCVAMFSVSLRGLTVSGAPRHGFVFLRGQGANHEHLLAENCGLDGFYCGIDQGGNDYGYNFQVTRCVFSGLVALNNGRHGWAFNGLSTANRSWFNANAVTSFGAVNNVGKGMVWIEGNGPNGVSQLNYNTYLNMNCEGNGDISVDLPTSRSCTFIGGHFVDKDTDGYAFRTPAPFNFNFGGRYVGQVARSSFTYVNTDLSGEGGIMGYITGSDDIKTKDLEVTNEPFIPKGWSILPKSLESAVVAADNLSNHQFALDLDAMPNTDGLMLRITRFGQRNFSGGSNQTYSYSMLVQVTVNTTGTMHLDWNIVTEDGCTVNSVTASAAGLITVDFNTDNTTFGTGFGVTEYQNSKETDFR